MPTRREREYYRQGFSDGMRMKGTPTFRENFSGYEANVNGEIPQFVKQMDQSAVWSDAERRRREGRVLNRSKPKRKLSAWQKYIKNKRNHITYRNGKLNLRAMGVQYRKKKRR